MVLMHQSDRHYAYSNVNSRCLLGFYGQVFIFGCIAGSDTDGGAAKHQQTSVDYLYKALPPPRNQHCTIYFMLVVASAITKHL